MLFIVLTSPAPLPVFGSDPRFDVIWAAPAVQPMDNLPLAEKNPQQLSSPSVVSHKGTGIAGPDTDKAPGRESPGAKVADSVRGLDVVQVSHKEAAAPKTKPAEKRTIVARAALPKKSPEVNPVVKKQEQQEQPEQEQGEDVPAKPSAAPKDTHQASSPAPVKETAAQPQVKEALEIGPTVAAPPAGIAAPTRPAAAAPVSRRQAVLSPKISRSKRPALKAAEAARKPATGQHPPIGHAHSVQARRLSEQPPPKRGPALASLSGRPQIGGGGGRRPQDIRPFPRLSQVPQERSIWSGPRKG